MTQNSDVSHVEPIEDQQASMAPTFWEIVWRHKFLLAFGLTVGLILGALYRAQIIPEYMSSTRVLVVKKRPDTMPLSGQADPRASFLEEYLGTHQVVLRSPLIVNAAVKKGKLQNLRSFADGTDPAAAVMGGLGITREATEGGAANILNITFHSRIAEDCPSVLDAIVESYRDFLDTTYHNVSEDTFNLITQAKDLLEKGLTEKESLYRKFRLGIPVLWKNKEGLTVQQERLYHLEKKRADLILRQEDVEERLEAFQIAIKNGESRETLLGMTADSVAKLAIERGRILTGEDPVAVALLQEQTLLEDLGPNHPQVRSLRRRIEYLRSEASRLLKEPGASLDPVEAHLGTLNRELETLKKSITKYTKMLKAEQDEAQKLVGLEIEDEFLRRGITDHRELFGTVVKRLGEINLLKDIGGYDLQRVSPSSAPWRIGVKTVPIMVVAGLLGLFCGLGLAFLTEVADKSFRTPEDVRRRLGLPIMGQIPVISTKEADAAQGGASEGPIIAPALCTYHVPKSRDAEAYRGVRTGLFFSTQGKGHRVVQVTSPTMGDGKSTLAANLAISIAQAGKTVILIDADFRRPMVHQLFGLTSRLGLGSILTGETEPPEVMLPSAVPGLSILPAGPVPPNPAELLSLPRFKELLTHIREKYDFIIIDTPPLLAVTDPCMVAPYVDGVLLTFRISKQNRPSALRAKEILTTLGATILGVVVNAVNQRGKGYGYYGYGYGDHYGYGGGYYHKEGGPVESARPVNV
jgi:capsular exopolysaccharide synthesis family protein